MYVEVRRRDWNIVGHKKVRKGVGGSKDDLEDLQECQSTLELGWNPDSESRERVVSVL